MKQLLPCIGLIVLMACGSSSLTDDELADLSRTEQYFAKFPSFQFHNVALGTTVFVAKSALDNMGYRPKSGQESHYENVEKETEVVFSDNDLIYDFKVFFFAEEDRSSVDEFKTIFSRHAVESHDSETFSIYHIETLSMSYKLTLFEQPEFLRLHYELKSAP